jgi:SAM-dependent methyltransferase
VLTYFSATVHEDLWTEHWGGYTVEELLAVARASPLTTLITDALPPTGLVLEAGCGLGQYVILLRERGWRAAGVDGSVEALATCRRTAAVPLAASDLRALAVRSGALAAYVSLGVVEHDPDGPGAILAEAHRVLAPGGILVVSVPYLNGARRLGSPWIRRHQAAVRARGGVFYQYAFTRRELLDAVVARGFTPLEAHPYDPARLPRGAWRRARHLVVPGGSRPGDRPTARRATAPDPPPRTAPAPVPAGRRGVLGRLVRGVLYTPPALRLLGHMLLVVARRS